MSFDDIAARLRAHRDPSDNHASPPDFDELYLLRSRILGVLIRDAREAAGMEPDALAAQAGVETETLVDWEFGQAMPSLTQLELLSYALEVPVSHFWGLDLLQPSHQHRPVNPREYTLLRDRLIGGLLRAAREAARLSVDEVAGEVGAAPGTLTAYELGQRSIPMPVLVTLASVCRVSLAYFLEHGNRVGEFLALQEDLDRFNELPDDLRHFVLSPVNQPYLELAMKLAAMGTEELRGVAEAILEITL